jgi:Domain of unknown function (DUF4145)
MTGNIRYTIPKIVMLCGHCGNRTSFEIVAEHSKRCPIGIDGDTVMSWRILLCSTCSKPTIEEDTQNVDRNIISSRSKNAKILYPIINNRFTDIPEKIGKKYMEALHVRNVSPGSCAVMIGRTLEAVCNHENAQGRNLAQKLNDLAQKDKIPNTLVEMAQQLRELRNLDAHEAEDEVTETDVPIIIDFVEAILEYLYVAPAKIEAVRTRLSNVESEGNE